LPIDLAPEWQRERGQALMLHLVHRVVVGAMEITPQQVVARVALVLHHPDHAAHRDTDQGQRMAGQHQRSFDGLRHHLGGAGGLQPFDLVSSRVRTITGTWGAWVRAWSSTFSAPCTST
jgi:hypothetical protein